MVFAHAVKADVTDQHDFVVFFGEKLPQVKSGILVQPTEQFGVHSRDAGWCFLKTFSIGIFTDGEQYFSHGTFDSRMVDTLARRNIRGWACFVARASTARGNRRIVSRCHRS